jgi:uncharacterized protein (DUF1697 family)
MEKVRYVVLLRGINVGGNNIIKMIELKKLFEEMGFENVITYIQSGNVIFDDSENNKTILREKIEHTFSEKLGSTIKTIIITSNEMKTIIEKKPEDFGEEKDKYKYNVIFLVEPLKAKDAIQEIKTRDGVDKIYEGEKVIYFSYLVSERTKSYISKVIETAIYKNISIRNWNTTEKLYELIEK